MSSHTCPTERPPRWPTRRLLHGWCLLAVLSMLLACAAPGSPPARKGDTPPGAGVWSDSMEKRRAALADALAGAGVEVTRTPDNQLLLRWSADRAFVGETAEPSAAADVVWRRTAQVLQATSSGGLWRVRVQGHSDASTADNQTAAALAAQRALRLRDLLVGHGLPSAALQVEAWGARAPLVANDTAEGRARNRRVELWVQE